MHRLVVPAAGEVKVEAEAGHKLERASSAAKKVIGPTVCIDSVVHDRHRLIGGAFSLSKPRCRRWRIQTEQDDAFRLGCLCQRRMLQMPSNGSLQSRYARFTAPSVHIWLIDHHRLSWRSRWKWRRWTRTRAGSRQVSRHSALGFGLVLKTWKGSRQRHGPG